MKRITPILLPILSLCMIMACSKPQTEEASPKEDPGVSFVVVNLTGHTFPPNDDKCGDPVTVVFELESDIETKQRTVSADNQGLLALKIEKGQLLRVRVRLEDGIITAESTIAFRDLPEDSTDRNHNIVLCPRDRLEFNF